MLQVTEHALPDINVTSHVEIQDGVGAAVVYTID